MDELKVFGIYPGNLNKQLLEKLSTMSEEEIWKVIYCIESEIFWMTHEDRNYEIDILDLEEKQYALEYVIYSTNRFGITFKEPSKDNHIEKNDSYQTWYQNWNNQIFLKNKEHKKIKNIKK